MGNDRMVNAFDAQGPKRTVVKRVEGKFYAEGDRVMKEGNTTHYSDGSRGMNLTVPVCEIWEHLEDREGVAKMVADALNAHASRQQ